MSAVAPAPPAAATGGRPAGFRPDVEGLRAIAVLSVLAYHAGLPLITGGFGGVDVFFVLSGFILSHVYLAQAGEKRFSYGRFLWARVARVYPLHIATLIGVGQWARAAVDDIVSQHVTGPVRSRAAFDEALAATRTHVAQRVLTVVAEVEPVLAQRTEVLAHQ